MTKQQQREGRPVHAKGSAKRAVFMALKAVPAAIALCAAGAALANDDEGQYIGYFRSGAGSGSTHGVGNCYYLGNGNGHGYRLGNECDSYGELGYAHTIATSPDGTKFVGKVMVNTYSGNSQWNGGFNMSQAYIEADNMPALNGGNVWVGERYYERPDIHVLDLQYINLNGQGGGIDNVGTGFGKFSWAIFKDNDSNVGAPGVVTGSNSAIRNNFLLRGMPVNPGGKLDVVLGYIVKEGAQQGSVRHNGWNAHVFHYQDVLGGNNAVGLQYGVGPGTGRGDPVSPASLAAYQANPQAALAGANANGSNRMGGSGSTELGSADKRLRAFDYLVIQPTSIFSTSFDVVYQQDKLSAQYGVAQGTVKWLSVGVRPEIAITQNFKIQGEVGYDRVTYPSASSQHLTKFTIAPTLTLGPGFYDRPELRAFVTHANWNAAATPTIAGNNYNSGNAFGSSTSGTTIGIQAETWFNEDWW